MSKTAKEFKKIFPRLAEWSCRWQMNFNVDKCKVIRFGDKKTKYDHKMPGELHATVNEQKDSGVVINNKLNSTKQCIKARNRANRMILPAPREPTSPRWRVEHSLQ